MQIDRNFAAAVAISYEYTICHIEGGDITGVAMMIYKAAISKITLLSF